MHVLRTAAAQQSGAAGHFGFRFCFLLLALSSDCLQTMENHLELFFKDDTNNKMQIKGRMNG